MPKFKVGDRVRRTKCSTWKVDLKLGDIVYVVETSPSLKVSRTKGGRPLTVMGTYGELRPWNPSSSNFELAPSVSTSSEKRLLLC